MVGAGAEGVREAFGAVDANVLDVEDSSCFRDGLLRTAGNVLAVMGFRLY